MFASSLAPPPKVEKYVPPVVEDTRKLADIDLSDELFLQYIATKKLLAEASVDESVPLNQKAQTTNSIVSILEKMARLRLDLYNAERLKTLETVLLAVLKDHPVLQEAFMQQYEAALNV